MGEYKGFRTNPGQQIGQLREILKDQYREGSIVTELIQNADDAEADVVRLALVHGSAERRNPLLRGPILVVLNDGFFRSTDREGLWTLGIGAKGGQGHSIGRFGLGMKSLFHWCEALLYAYSENQEASPGESNRVDVINPWSTTQNRPDVWDEIADDADILTEQARAIAVGLRRWFCLWIPLRHSALLRDLDPQNSAPPLSDAMPGDDVSGGTGCIPRPDAVVPLLPLLRTVREVCHGNVSEEVGWQARWRVVREDRPEWRRRGPDVSALVPGRRHPIRGAIKLEEHERSETFEYRGFEWTAADKALTDLLAQDQGWPVVAYFDDKTRQKVRREKAEPHAAVVVLETPRESPGRATVEASEYAFLPLTDATDKKHTDALERSYRLVLHGAFLVESGRKRELGEAQSSQDVPTKWNGLLRDRGLSPLVLPSLAYFARSTRLSYTRAVALAVALGSLERLKLLLGAKSASGETALCWQEEIGDDGGGVMRLRRARAYQELPARRGNPEPAFALFGGLPKLARRYSLVFGKAAGLRQGGASAPAKPTAETVAALLEVLDVKSALDVKRLAYLKELVSSAVGEASVADSRLKRALGGALRRLFERKASEDRKRDEGWVGSAKTLLGFVDDSQKLPVRLAESATEEALAPLIRAVACAVEGIVPVPQTWALLNEGTKGLREGLRDEELAKALRRLEKEEGETQDVLEATACSLIRCWEGRTSTESRCETPALFQLRNERGEGKRVTWNEIVELASEGGVSLYTDGPAKAVESALAEVMWEPAQQCTRETVRGALGLKGGPEGCLVWCLKALRSQRITADEGRRETALRALLNVKGGLGTVLEQEFGKTALRYLLHGECDHRVDGVTELVVGEAQQDPTWGWLLGHVFEPWTTVPARLAQHLSRVNEEALGLARVTKELILDRLARRFSEGVPHTIPFDELGEAREAIVAELLRQQPEHFRRVPIHRDAQGGALDLQPSCYLDPGNLDPRIRALPGLKWVATGSEDLKALYRNAEVKDWTDWEALDFFAGLTSPGGYADLILSTLKRVQRDGAGERRKDTLRRLGSAAWLPVASSPASWVAPHRVIGTEKLLSLLGPRDLCRGESEYLRQDLLKEGFNRNVGEGLRDLFAGPAESVRAAVKELSEWGRKKHGQVDLELPIESAAAMLGVLEGIGELSDFAKLGRMVLTDVPVEDRQPLMHSLLAVGTRQTLVDVASRLANKAENEAEPAAFTDVYLRVLRAWARCPDAVRSDLRSCRLRNRTGDWKASTALCVGEADIDPSFVLHQEEEEAVRAVLRIPAMVSVDSGGR